MLPTKKSPPPKKVTPPATPAPAGSPPAADKPTPPGTTAAPPGSAQNLPPLRKPRPGKLTDIPALVTFLEKSRTSTAAVPLRPVTIGRPPPGIVFRRAKVGDLLQLVDFLNRTRDADTPEVNREQLMRDWAVWGYWLALEPHIRACASWQVNNFVALARDLRFEAPEDRPRLAPGLLGTLEGAAWAVACQVLILLVSRKEPAAITLYQRSGFRPIDPEAIRRDWREIITPYLRPDIQVLLKILE